jgi:hypothetical protein
MARKESALSDLHQARGTFEGLLEARLAALKKSAATMGPLSQSYLDNEAHLGTATRGLAAARNYVGGRPHDIKVTSRTIFWIVATVVAIAEISVNKVLFDMILQQSAALSFIAALVVSVGLVAIAHWSGFCWRQIWSDTDQKFIANRFFGRFSYSLF